MEWFCCIFTVRAQKRLDILSTRFLVFLTIVLLQYAEMATFPFPVQNLLSVLRRISISGLFWLYDLESVSHILPHDDNFHQVWS